MPWSIENSLNWFLLNRSLTGGSHISVRFTPCASRTKCESSEFVWSIAIREHPLSSGTTNSQKLWHVFVSYVRHQWLVVKVSPQSELVRHEIIHEISHEISLRAILIKPIVQIIAYFLNSCSAHYIWDIVIESIILTHF